MSAPDKRYRVLSAQGLRVRRVARAFGLSQSRAMLIAELAYGGNQR